MIERPYYFSKEGLTLINSLSGEKRVLVENTKEISWSYVESGTGYDVHYITIQKEDESGMNCKVNWYCWHLSREFSDALDKHGLPPTHLDYDSLM